MNLNFGEWGPWINARPCLDGGGVLAAQPFVHSPFPAPSNFLPSGIQPAALYPALDREPMTLVTHEAVAAAEYFRTKLFFLDSEKLMMDPFLDYINKILTEEGMDDAQVDDVSYQAIFSSFHEMLGEHLTPNSYADSTTSHDDVFDLQPPHQHIYHHGENGPDEKHVKVVNPSDGICSMSSEPRISLPATGHPQSSFQQKGDEVGCTLKHDSGFQGHVMPMKSTQIAECHAMKTGMYHSGSRLNSNEGSGSLSPNYDTLVQNYHNAIKLNDEVLDMTVPCWRKDAVVEGLSGLRCMGGQEQGNGNFKLPSADEEFSSKLAGVDLSFENLRLNDVYTDLYVGEPSSLGSSVGAARDSKHNGDKRNSLGSKFGKRRTSEVQAFVDVREVLVSCAQAVEIGDARKANQISQELRQVHGASANGTSLQRTAHFLSKALAVRMRGIGEYHFRAMSNNMPSTTTILQASNFANKVIPFVKLMHYFANQSILKAAEGASRLHIVDYGLKYGIQWPCLINALADRQGGPPLLVITGIELPQPGVDPAKRLEESGQQLAASAKIHNVPFQYHAIVSNKWEDLDAASLNLHEGEVLVVNCIKCLRHLAEESVDLALTISPRQKVLTFMRSLNPHLLLTGVKSYLAQNSPFFVPRFREAVYSFSNIFDMIDTLWGDAPQRLILERSYFYGDILNTVGCEGVERLETYKQWHARITKAGFEQLPIPPSVVSRSRSHLKQHHHKDFFIHDDANGWMLMGWKGRTTLAISAWKPSFV